MQWGFAVLTLKQRKEKQIKKVAENASCVASYWTTKGLFVYDRLHTSGFLSTISFTFYISLRINL